MTDAAKQHKTGQSRFTKPQTGKKSSYPARVAEVIAGLFESFRKIQRQPSPYKWCRRATVSQLVAGECSNSSLSPGYRPATTRRQRHEFEHPVAVAVTHEFESSVSLMLERCELCLNCDVKQHDKVLFKYMEISSFPTMTQQSEPSS
ncbi:hypothetical protein L596_001016 [Steinernema carpocapsae]|uniref:Uncharacterized protein n=1 Tax=Steinernema carpocapsae TaxID=34508 RepID=A0A4U8UKC9_STECR|nr:hypothetical protein L596_001016 [Steinernema carpocapsae]